MNPSDENPYSSRSERHADDYTPTHEYTYVHELARVPVRGSYKPLKPPMTRDADSYHCRIRLGLREPGNSRNQVPMICSRLDSCRHCRRRVASRVESRVESRISSNIAESQIGSRTRLLAMGQTRSEKERRDTRSLFYFDKVR